MNFLLTVLSARSELTSKCSQVRNRSSSAFRSAAVRIPILFTTKLSSTVASCDLIPHGTFNPAALHSRSGMSVLESTDETGTRKRSAPLRPITMAGRTLRLVKSVNGIGRRTTSFLEQFVKDVVRVVVPDLLERFLGKLEPRLTFRVGWLHARGICPAMAAAQTRVACRSHKSLQRSWSWRETIGRWLHLQDAVPQVCCWEY